MEASVQLRVPTIAVPVRVALVGHTEHLKADVFVVDSPRSGRTELIDDVVALFEGDGEFVPMRGDTGVRLIGKSGMTYVSVRRRAATVEPSDEPSEVLTLFDHQHRVEVELVGGHRLEGSLLDSSPSSRSRAVDHLNRAGRFVRLWGAEEHFLINKGHIVQVGELEWTPE